jgi:predicted DNA-binding transcriptional regulator AlpA
MRKRLRYRDLRALGIVDNRPTLRQWILKRGFPRGQLTGPNVRTWGEDEIERWIASRPTGPKAAPIIKPRRGRPRKSEPAADAPAR